MTPTLRPEKEREMPKCEKMTRAMQASLLAMRESLLCPLCNKLMNETSMLNCGHSFCYSCIISYTSNHWNCPVVGCSIPVSAGVERGTSYVKKNPQIAAVISALNTIEENLAIAPCRWWEEDEEDHERYFEFEKEDDVLDFERMLTNKEVPMEKVDCKGSTLSKTPKNNDRKIRTADSNKEDDLSSGTQKLVQEKTDAETPGEWGLSSEADVSPMRERRLEKINQSCSVPSHFSHQFSPITQRNSPSTEEVSIEKDKGNKFSATSGCQSVRLSIEFNSEKNERQNTDISETPASSMQKHTTPPLFNKQKHATLSLNSVTETRLNHALSTKLQPKVMLLHPLVKPTDVRCVKKCISSGMIALLRNPTITKASSTIDDILKTSYDFNDAYDRESFVEALTTHRKDDGTPPPLSCYFISTKRDYSMDEGIVVPRSFGYYLAVAVGVFIIDVQFISKFPMNTDRKDLMCASPFFPATGERLNVEEQKFHIIGASDHSWYTPQKARIAALERYQSWLRKEERFMSSDTLTPGTDLLYGHNIFVMGEFANPQSTNRCGVGKKKQKLNELEEINLRGNIILLLQLCGAKVHDLNSVVLMSELKNGLHQQGNDVNKKGISQVDSVTLNNLFDLLSSTGYNQNEKKTLVLVNNISGAKFALELLSQYCSNSGISKELISKVSIVSSKWLFDSIGDFVPKELSTYDLTLQL